MPRNTHTHNIFSIKLELRAKATKVATEHVTFHVIRHSVPLSGLSELTGPKVTKELALFIC